MQRFVKIDPKILDFNVEVDRNMQRMKAGLGKQLNTFFIEKDGQTYKVELNIYHTREPATYTTETVY